ncbi:hypothetical protein SODALDRAFT_364435 [Sodiomyces alkalinus F11]|uniref:Uncharacterized protein n=1 Tax=Sodiomyces alkalinus (strain CBS 110278 / VKM F-3762 / F11) TaxID=1314773 RepID=A0A3N2PJ03_SODAK|nr:hypothetical protein SODALDRAFT_364435 [Sodiomyces alkalinus F11]ROT34505.1 hypothetical protein SODALDRAFT_364435 [Sodiomyces alkalinus F11]
MALPKTNISPPNLPLDAWFVSTWNIKQHRQNPSTTKKTGRIRTPWWRSSLPQSVRSLLRRAIPRVKPDLEILILEESARPAGSSLARPLLACDMLNFPPRSEVVNLSHQSANLMPARAVTNGTRTSNEVLQARQLIAETIRSKANSAKKFIQPAILTLIQCTNALTQNTTNFQSWMVFLQKKCHEDLGGSGLVSTHVSSTPCSCHRNSPSSQVETWIDKPTLIP